MAWLESPAGVRTPIHGSCFVGRSATNNIVLPDDRVSRRHAMVHAQGQNDFWVMDLGSSNGTYVNGRRIAQPSRLADKDRLEIGGHSFTFRHPTSMPQTDATRSGTEKTIQDIKSVNCWLLVADMESSTRFIKSTSPDESLRVTGRWLSNCKQLVEDRGGVINKFLGDGFLAYWPERDKVAGSIAGAIKDLKRLQQEEHPRFRVVLHYGKVFMGGAASHGEESLLGNDVNFVFRMEKLAGSMGTLCLMSEPASERLQPAVPVTEEGRRSVSGFDGDFLFFSF